MAYPRSRLDGRLARRGAPAWRFAAATSLVVALGGSAHAQTVDGALGDVFDPFFRHYEPGNRAAFQELPGETVDLFTGTLRITQQDLALPGAAGLDLRIVRTYNSRIWGRADELADEPFLAEKEHSVLGWGWSFHMGRLINPYANPPRVGTGCGGDLPVFEAPDGSAQVFYPVDGSNTQFISKSFWRLDVN
jgi:hypothetical protein